MLYEVITIGRVQLAKAWDFYRSRSAVAQAYTEAFSRAEGLIVPPDGPGNAWHLYLLRLDLDALDCDRDTFAAELQGAGLGISMHFIPHFELTYFRERYGLRAGDFPNADAKYRSTVTLPFWPGMSGEQVERVIAITLETAKRHTGRR